MKKFYCAIALIALLVIPAIASAQLDAESGLGMNFGDELGMGTRDIRQTVASIINVALSLLGIVAVVLILYGGFIWMISAGEKEKTDKAKKIIISGVIGLVIILSAYAIANFIISSLLEATTTT